MFSVTKTVPLGHVPEDLFLYQNHHNNHNNNINNNDSTVPPGTPLPPHGDPETAGVVWPWLWTASCRFWMRKAKGILAWAHKAEAYTLTTRRMSCGVTPHPPPQGPKIANVTSSSTVVLD